MALSLYDINISQEVLGNELRPYQVSSGDNDDKSVTLAELEKKAVDLGFVAYHRPSGDIELIKQFIANDIPVVTRTLTSVDEDIGHYRVVIGYDDARQQILQNDSLQGRELWFDYNLFLDLWKPYSYEYLVFVSPDKMNLAEAILGVNADKATVWRTTATRLEQEAKNNPSDVQLQFSLAVAYYNIGEFQRSVNTFESIENQLSFRTLWYQIEPLLAYQKLGLYDELSTRIENILNNHNRAFSELYQIRGEVYLAQGRVAEAKQEFELALIYNRNFEPAKQSLSMLN